MKPAEFPNELTQAAFRENELLARIERLTAENEKLSAALKPFADAVYNDNGDMTITPCDRQFYVKAYFTRRTLKAAP